MALIVCPDSDTAPAVMSEAIAQFRNFWNRTGCGRGVTFARHFDGQPQKYCHSFKYAKHKRNKRFKIGNAMMLSLFGAFLCMTGKPQISPQLWERMRRHYLTGGVTLKELSQLYGVGYSTLRRHASTNDWFTHKRSQRILVEAEVRNRLSQQLLNQASNLQRTAGYCIPMPASKHYDTLIRLMQLQIKLKSHQPIAPQEVSPQPSNVVPLRRRSVARAEQLPRR